MTIKAGIKITLLLVTSAILSGCMVHGRHHYGHGHHHSRIHLHGHVHGKPGKVIGALVAGAIIGHAIHAASHRRHYEANAAPAIEPGDRYYLSTLEGECLWVEVDNRGQQHRTQVDTQYCEQDD